MQMDSTDLQVFKMTHISVVIFLFRICLCIYQQGQSIILNNCFNRCLAINHIPFLSSISQQLHKKC